MSLRTRVRITNTSNRPIDVGGRWIQPGAFDAFDLAQVPPEWRGAAVVDSTIDIDAGDIIQDGENLYVQQSDGSRAAIVLGKYNQLTGNITKIAPVTQAQYDALSPVDAETLYVIVEAA